MALKVVFPINTSNISVSGLYQWDYGQVLEIECADIGSEIVEVHFACSGMSEAIVRPCTFHNSIGTVGIPDQCLEQTSAITAWIYRISGAEGHTIKTITMPIIARIRPSKAYDVTAENIDKYTELITEVNEIVDALKEGNITVAKASNADLAARATTAGNAESASYATSAGNANNATNATNATNANTATVAIGMKYTTVAEGEFAQYDVFAEGNFIKPNTKYVLIIGGVPTEGFSNAEGTSINFIHISNGGILPEIVYGSLDYTATYNKVYYHGTGVRIMTATSTSALDELPKLTKVLECEQIPI